MMRLAFVGDIALGDHPKAVGFGFRSRYPDGIPRALADRLRPPGVVPDLLFGNLEFPLAGSANGATLVERQCRGTREYAAFLAAAGVTALNVANNHSYQHGSAAFDETVGHLRGAGIHVVGTPDDFSESGVLRIGGLRIALLGWSDRPRQYAQDPPPYNELSAQAYGQIADAARRADVVVASVHWGDEFILLPSDRERGIARAMIDAGASFVIGHHPHVVREVERYGAGVIAYSLGNFIGDMLWDFRTRYTAWLVAHFEGGRIASAELTPGVIERDYFPRPLPAPPTRLVARFARTCGAEAERVARAGYAAVAEAARRRHIRRTAWMMLRSMHRYPSGVATEVLLGALSHRLRAVLSGSGRA